MTTKTQNRPIHRIAKEIHSNWDNVNFAAVSYLNAMDAMDSIDGNYMMDSNASVVRYFLSNASGFRGVHAKRLRAELKAML